MATEVNRARCLLHPGREAVARCVGCATFFCRECVSEHGGTMLCASCIEAQTAPPEEGRTWSLSPFPIIQIFLGLCALWLLAYGAGLLLLKIPAPIHTGEFFETIIE